MSTPRFLVVASVASLAAVAAMVLANALDAPVFYVPALLAILAILAAREGWLWRGDGRGWLMSVGTLLAAFAIAFLFRRLFG